MVATRTVRWRPNWLGWVVVSVLAVTLGGGLPVLHEFQSQRIVERIRVRAEDAEKRLAGAKALAREDEIAKALSDVIKNYDLYLRHRPGDTNVQIKLALAVAEQADRVKGNAQVQWNAYRVLSRAVAKIPDNPKLLERLASIAMRLQQWEEAASLWQELWQGDPGRTSAGVNLARCRIARAKVKEAIDVLLQVVQRDPSVLEAYVLLARCYRDPAVQDYESAQKTIDEMVARNQESVGAYAQRAAFWWWVSQTTANPAEATQASAEARKDVAAALGKSPTHLEALLISADIALHDGDLTRAKEALASAEKASPDDRRVWISLVNWSRLTGDAKNEETYLKRLAEVDPSWLSELAELYLSRQPPDLAATRQVVLRMQRARFPSQHLQFWQARLTFLQGDRVKGLRGLEELYQSIVRESDPLKEWVGLALAEAYFQVGMRESAGAVISQLRESAPDSPRVRTAWAKWLLQTGQAETAISEFQGISSSVSSQRLFASGGYVKDLFLAKLAVVRTKPLNSPEWREVEQILRQIEQSSSIAEEDKVLLKARYLEARGQIEEAVKLIEKELAESKAGSNLRLELAFLFARHDRPAEAMAVLRAARDKGELRGEVLSAMVELADLLGEDKRAEIIAEVTKQIQDSPPEEKRGALRALARRHLRMGETSQAQSLWEELARTDPNDVEPARALMELACQQGDFSAAQRWLKEIEKIEGSSGRVALLSTALLMVYQSMQKTLSPADRARLLTQAKEELAVLEKRLPYWPDVLRLKARIALLEGRLAAAIDQYRTLERRGLLMREGKEELARLLLLRGQHEEAQKVLAGLPFRSNDLQALKLQSELLLREGRASEAIAKIEPVMATSSDPVDWLWYAQFLSRAKQVQEADAAFAHVIALAPHWPEAQLAQIMHLIATNRKAQAESVVKDWQGRNLQDISDRRALAIGFELLGQTEQAEKIYRQILEENPGNAELLLEWAGFCLRRGRTPECRAVLERLVSTDQGSLQISDSTRLDARRNLAQLLGLSPDYRDVCRAKELLEANLREQGLPTDRCLLARVLSRRSERSSKQRAIAEYQTVVREGGILSPEDRLAYAQALAYLGSWPDARMQLLELVNTESPQPAHLVFFVSQLIKYKSPAVEIEPYLKKLQFLPGYDFVALELQTQLAVRDGREEEIHSLWDEKLDNAIRSSRWTDAEVILGAAESSGLISWTETGWTRLVEVRGQAILGKALFLGRQKRLQEALDLCQKAAESLPITAVAATAMSILRLNRTSIQEDELRLVEAWLTKAKESDAKDKRVAIDYASFLNLAGRYDEVERAYRELLNRNDLSDMEKALIQNNLAYILAVDSQKSSEGTAKVRLQEAEDLIDKAIAVIGPIGSLLDTRSVVRMGLGKNREALNDAQQAVLEEPSPLSYFHLVQALIAVGDTPTALREWQRARQDLGLSPEAIPPIERTRFREVASQLSQ